MNNDIANAAAVLFLAGAAVYLATLATLFTHKDDACCTGCSRRGCRRMPAGQGCNHAPPADGSAARRFKKED
jgi:hypothetical protein